MRKYLLVLLVSILTACMAFAQKNGGRQITGKLLDAQTKEPLIGATIVVKGTTTATSASLNGSFKLSVPEGAGTLVISYIGYETKELDITGDDLGVIELQSNQSTMKEVTIIGDQAIDRKTPIAVSTIGPIFIEEKGAGVEFPELLASTPGVMATKVGGGYGDSRVSIRGFSSNNVALLINGMPANDPEKGTIYWNDYAGLKDVTTSMQVQRGLGASKVAVPSLGGTINITTTGTDSQQGGSITQTVGNNGMSKTALYLSSGLNDKGWATSILLSRDKGGLYGDGLNYSAYGYFFNLSKVINDKQSLSLSVMGATQSHGERFTYNSIATYRAAPQGGRYNSDWGYLNGQFFSGDKNKYNKPIAMLRYNWEINGTTQFASTAYGSYGEGDITYAGGPNGAAVSLAPTNAAVPRTGDAYSPVDFNAITKSNMANPDGSSLVFMKSDVNHHQWYGDLSTLKKKLNDNLDLLAGLDLRYYQSHKYFEVNDLLGGKYIVDTRSDANNYGDKNNPGAHAVVGDKFYKNYEVNMASEGLFLQTEYNKDDLSAFVSVAGSNTSHRRIDYFNYTTGSADATTKWINILGYQAKGGANYNLDSHNNVFANVGFLQRPPLIASLFLNSKNDRNPNAVPEKLFSYELGYGYRSSQLTANVNLYRSTYRDKSVTPKSVLNTDGSISTANLSGVNELHQGVEVDFRYMPIRDVTLRGQLSVGDYHYLTDAGPVQVISDAPGSTPQTIQKLYLKGMKVGDVAQTTAALGIDANVLPKLRLGADMNYYGNYSSFFNFATITTAGKKAWEVPNYALFNVNAVYKFKVAGLDASLLINVYNLFDTEYISDSYDTNALGSATTLTGVFYGFGRTYTTGIKVKF